MNILIAGYGRHGKDTACEYLKEKYGLSFKCSSTAACEIAVYPQLKEKYGYESPEECFEDRHNHRDEWYQLISEFNDEPTRLARMILEDSDIYAGMRSKRELDACVEDGVFDLVVWVDASDRLPPESEESCTITSEDADVIIYNNHSIEDFQETLDSLYQTFIKNEVE